MSEGGPADSPAAGSESLAEDPEPTGFTDSLNRMFHYVDVTAAILLAIATVATAWCAYQATRWSGVQAVSFAQASTNRVESTRAYTLSLQLLSIDADLFMQWVNAYAAGDEELLDFYEGNLMRADFLPYLQEWVESDPLNNPNALRNPLVNETYQQALLMESERLAAEAEAKFTAATDANQTGDDYVLATVMFASVLFFAGISTKFRSIRIEAALIGLAVVMLVLGAIQIGGLPVH